MSDIAAYLEMGIRHIADWRAADHLLFLCALAAIYRPRDWRALLLVVSAFTVGHSITLALAATGTVVLPAPWIEFLIPVTIVATGVENLVRGANAGGPTAGRGAWLRPSLALGFGLIHGAGFAGYLRTLLVDEIAWPLLGFNLGVEVGQVLILAVASALFVAVDRVIAVARRTAPGDPSPARYRAIGISVATTCVALVWAGQRLP